MKESKDAKITFRLPEDEKQKLKEMAEEMDVPFSQLIREALKAYFKRKERLD